MHGISLSFTTRTDANTPHPVHTCSQLDPLLRATVSPEGDVNDASGWSPYPGNINQLVIKLSTYVHQLNKTGGIISEFVNPKYK